MPSFAGRSALLLLALIGVAHPVHSQQLMTSAQARPYQPGVDILDYDFTLELPDSGAFLRGDALITLRRSAETQKLRLDLVRTLDVRAVEVNGRAVRAERSGDTIDVPLDGTRDTVRVRVAWDGMVRDGLVVRKDARGRWTWFGDNWPDRTRQWLPTVDHPSDKATVGFTVLAPDSRTVVANGTLQSTRTVTVRGRSMHETRWRESHPIATYLMVIAAGPLVRHDLAPTRPCPRELQRGACVPQQVYVLPENTSWLPGAFAAARPIVALFDSLVGPFPYEKLAHLQSSTRFGGMENATAIFYDGQLFPDHRVGEGLIAHETAHQWFGDAVTEREWGHLWLSEGFATYFATLWTRASRGDSAWHAELAQIRRQILADSTVRVRPVIDTAQREYLALLNANSYQKGGYVLSMLHEQLGDSAFFGGLRAYYAEHRDGNALSDDLRAALERSSGRDLSQFFDDWLRRPGVAQPALGWAWNAADGTVSVRVMQPEAHMYSLRIPVVVTDANGATTRVVLDAARVADQSIPLAGHWTSRPCLVRLDPDERLLARTIRL